MGESGGEEFVIAIVVVISIAVIIYVFAHFIFLGGSFADSSLCYLSSQATNFFYNGLCLSNYLCFSSTLQSEGISPPLLGCSTTSTAYTSSSSSTQILSGLSTSISQCIYQYGAYQGLDVLPNGPAVCGVNYINSNKNLTFANLTNYLAATTYTTEVSCINHTAAQSCADPVSSSNPNGFSCDTLQPSECQATSADYFNCRAESGYTPFTQGFSLDTIPLNTSASSTSAANNLTDYLCEASQGCYFNKAVGTCTNLTGSSLACTDTYTNFCERYPNQSEYCTVGYDPITSTFEAPSSCSLFEPVKSTSVVNVSYASYLKPGVNLLYSYKNSTSAKFVNITSNESISKSQIYIVYLNSFAGTRFAPKVINLPQECAPISYLNNYPTSGIQYECSRALFSYVAIAGSGAGVNPGFIVKSSAIATGGGFLYNECVNASICGSGSALTALSTATLKTTGLSQCLSSIWSFTQAYSIENDLSKYIEGTNGLNFLGRNLVYLCAVNDS